VKYYAPQITLSRIRALQTPPYPTLRYIKAKHTYRLTGETYALVTLMVTILRFSVYLHLQLCVDVVKFAEEL
jgi:hypothetical protein